MEEDQKFSNILVYQHDHAHLKQAGSVNSASSGDSTHGAGTSDSKWNEPEPESGWIQAGNPVPIPVPESESHHP